MSIYHDQLISIRRQLHQNPEEGWSEFTTTAFLVKTLRGYGYQVLLAATSLIRMPAWGVKCRL